MAGGDGMRAFDSAAIFRSNMQTAGDAKELDASTRTVRRTVI
jgi:hypothetical protein